MQLRRILKDSLYKNSSLLMLNTALMTGMGFLFWTVNARLFSTTIIGLATTLISAMMLISNFSNLGMGNAVIRFASRSKNKSNYINTAFTLGALVSILITGLFLVLIPTLVKSLDFLQSNIYYSILFIIVVITWVIFNLTEAILLSYRKAEWILIKNAVFSVLKLIFPFLFISFGVIGIIGSWGISALIGIIVSLTILFFKTNLRFKPVIFESVIKKGASFSLFNHVAGLANQLPNLLVPLILTAYLSPESTALFYVSLMISGLLYTVPNAIGQSLFAEGSYSSKNLKKKSRKAFFIAELIVIMGIGCVSLVGKYLLLIFGTEYQEAYALLLLLSFSSIFITYKQLRIGILNIQKRVKRVVLIDLLTTICTFLGIIFFLHKGLYGVGIGWLIGQATILFIPMKNEISLR